MFRAASIRLTIWYVAILMGLSLMFSTWLYIEATNEVSANLNAQASHPLAKLLPNADIVQYLDQQYRASQTRIFWNLAFLNVGVLTAGSFLAYFLAQRTLRPIESALAAQNRFTADASHELRTPLTAMKTEIEVALRNPKLPVQDARNLLGSNVEEIDRLSKLAEGLLILARTGDKPQLQKIPVHLIAQKTSKRFTAIAAQKDIIIEEQLRSVMAMADDGHIDSIVGILLDNAIKYSQKKSVVTLQVTVCDNQACISVHNEGPAIAPDDMARIFDRFYRADTARSTEGHGLGLAIAQKLAANMDATLSAKSDKNGTVFTLRLPLARS